MTTELRTIDKIGFEDGTTIELRDLPEELQQQVVQYNKWTTDEADISRQLNELTSQLNVIRYARSGIWAAINRSASQLQTEDPARETPTSVNEQTDVQVAPEDSER